MPADPSMPPARRHWFWIAATLAGLALRVALLPLAPRYGYMPDHDDFVRWGIQAADHGLLTLYDHPPPRWDVRVYEDGKWSITQRAFDRLCNYPPLAAVLLGISGAVFKLVSSDRLINTITSRAVFESWSILADFALAAGCAAIVRLCSAGPPWPASVATGGRRYEPGRGVRWTYLLALLLPPLWWDSVLWGQMDSVVLAPAVWMLWAMLAHRWLLAAVLYGVAAGLKPQAVLLAPVWAASLLLVRPVWKPLLSLILAAAGLFVIALPFTLHSGAAWWRAGYVENLVDAYSDKTTLFAFNIWYLDLLLADAADPAARWLGLTRDAWGKVLLMVGLAAAFLWAWRFRREPRLLIVFAALTLLAFVMLPTRVHERYLLLVLPFLLTAAMLWPRFWPGLLILAAVATAQITWPLWLTMPPGGWTSFEQQARREYNRALTALPPEQRSAVKSFNETIRPLHEEYWQARSHSADYEWAFTLLALLGSAATVIAAARLHPPPAPASRPDRISSSRFTRTPAKPTI